MKRQRLILLGIFSLFALLVVGVFGFFFFEQRAKEKWLSNLALSNILIESNDLPPSYSPGLVEIIEPDEYFRFAQAKRQVILTPNGSQAGEVRVYLFTHPGEQEKLYNLFSLIETPEGMMPYDTPEIGDRYLVAADPMNFIVFTRCTAIGYIELEKAYLQEGYSFDWLISHAQNLDERLESIACK